MVDHLLVVKTAAIGDCLNTLPAVRALRRALPDARLTWLVGRAAADAVVDQVERVDWIVADDALLIRPRPLPLLSLMRTLRARRFDTALILHRTKGARLFAAAAGARRRVGLVRDAGDRTLLTDAVVDERGMHEADRYWRAAERVVGRPLPRDAPGWTPPADARARAAALWSAWGWRGYDRVIVLAPGGGVNPRTRFELKRWPVEKFAEVARHIVAEPDRRVLVIGVSEDIQSFLAHLGPVAGVETCADDLRLIGALLARADACVANDSGLMHLAAAIGVPTVGVFGPTDPGVYAPYGPGHLVVRHRVPCQPCYKDDGVWPLCLWEHRCMRDLAPTDVVGAVTTLLERKGHRVS